jgi:hypothetical protein
MFTVEGQIEQMSRFARSVNNATGWRRLLGKGMFALPLWLFLGGSAVWAIALVMRWAF